MLRYELRGELADMLMLLKVFGLSRGLSKALALDAGGGMVAEFDRMLGLIECWSGSDAGVSWMVHGWIER